METCFIRDLKVGLKNINLNFIVLEVGRPSTTKEGHEIRTCKIADRSACIHLSVWGEIGAYIVVGDICRLTKGYVSLWKGATTLYIGKGGEIVKTGEFCFIFNETHNLSDPNQAAAAAAAGQLQQQQQYQPGPVNKLLDQTPLSSSTTSTPTTTPPPQLLQQQPLIAAQSSNLTPTTAAESLSNPQII